MRGEMRAVVLHRYLNLEYLPSCPSAVPGVIGVRRWWAGSADGRRLGWAGLVGFQDIGAFGPPSVACARNGGWWKCERVGRPRGRQGTAALVETNNVTTGLLDLERELGGTGAFLATAGSVDPRVHDTH